MIRVTTGLDILAADPAPIKGRRWALLANHAAVTRELDPARGVLAAAAGPPTRIFAPEHGLDGVAQDMETVDDQRDGLTGAPVRSLYGNTAATLRPRSEDLGDLDILVVDLPDIGSRYYTFAATMDAVMAGCETDGVELLVLDRPNPIGGVRREGGPVTPGCESFVSQIPTPVRHGLTLGEIALLLRRERYGNLDLGVVTLPRLAAGRMVGRNRSAVGSAEPQHADPRRPRPIYPGGCLVEATNLSEGRGTTRPFHLIGAPWADAEAATAELRALDLPGVAFRAARFRPQFGKHASRICSGVEIHVTDRGALEPVALGLHLLRVFHDLNRGDFSWRAEPYEFVSEVPALDLLTGSPAARRCIEDGTPFEPLFDEWRDWVATFEGNARGNPALPPVGRVFDLNVQSHLHRIFTAKTASDHAKSIAKTIAFLDPSHHCGIGETENRWPQIPSHFAIVVGPCSRHAPQDESGNDGCYHAVGNMRDSSQLSCVALRLCVKNCDVFVVASCLRAFPVRPAVGASAHAGRHVSQPDDLLDDAGGRAVDI